MLIPQEGGFGNGSSVQKPDLDPLTTDFVWPLCAEVCFKGLTEHQHQRAFREMSCVIECK